jgi:integrase
MNVVFLAHWRKLGTPSCEAIGKLTHNPRLEGAGTWATSRPGRILIGTGADEITGQGVWVFRSRSGTPIDPKNAANRHLRPVAKELGLALGGWHDFRHTLSTQLLRRYPTKVVSELLGHSSVQTTLSVYQHVETDQFRAPLNEIATELLPDVTKLAASRD